MKNVILDKSLFVDLLHVNAECDAFCAVFNGSLLKLHENAELYTYVRSDEGTPCKIYFASSRETICKNRGDSTDAEWIEAIVDEQDMTLYFCRKESLSQEERIPISGGKQVSTISKSLCSTMDRLSNNRNRVSIICRKKRYGEIDKAAFQKRSVVDLSTIDSSGVDIIYFDGADKLIEKLLYGGCRELTVFITEVSKAKSIKRVLDKLSRRAPFSNRITVVVGETYAPKTTTALLVGNAADLSTRVPARIFFSVNYAEGEGIGASVGQNTAELIPDPSDHRLKPHALQYITSIMSELVLHAISEKEYRARRLFKVNAKTLATETIIKED